MVLSGNRIQYPAPALKDFDILLRTDPAYRNFAIDYDKNQMYDRLLYSSDHTDELPLYARTFLQCVQAESTNVHIFVDGTYQTVPK